MANLAPGFLHYKKIVQLNWHCLLKMEAHKMLVEQIFDDRFRTIRERKAAKPTLQSKVGLEILKNLILRMSFFKSLKFLNVQKELQSLCTYVFISHYEKKF